MSDSITITDEGKTLKGNKIMENKLTAKRYLANYRFKLKEKQEDIETALERLLNTVKQNPSNMMISYQLKNLGIMGDNLSRLINIVALLERLI